MIRVVLAAVLLLASAAPLAAAEWEIGIRHLIAAPSESGALEIEASRGFAATAEAFFSERLSTQLAVSFLNPQANLGDVDLGTLGVNSYSLTARFHIAGQRRLSGYAGAGAATAIFGNLDDQTGDAIDVTFDRKMTYIAEAGLRYRLIGRAFVDVGVSYMPLEAESQIRRDDTASVPPRIEIDPLTVTVSGSWRF